MVASQIGCAGDDPVTGADSADSGFVSFDSGAASTDAAAASAPDAGSPAYDGGQHDASTSGQGCQLGAAGSFATDQQLDLFGDVIYFAKGQVLPKGRYRATYEDGCMKYNNIFMWTVNANAGDGWWLVGASSSERVTLLPGVFPALVVDGFASFADCVAANKQLPAKEFEFAGGKLGIWLNDVPYQDNQAGEGGRNPKWSLTLLVDACPPGLVLL